MLEIWRPVGDLEGLNLAERDTTHRDCSKQEPAAPARPQGALALVGAWREFSDEEIESLIEEIYAAREKDTGRRVELDAWDGPGFNQT